MQQPTDNAEFNLIERYFRRSNKQPDIVLDAGDDAAVLKLAADEQLVVSCDSFVQGRHFLADISAAAIAHKALAVNLSDLAAMGATPRWFTLALTLPDIDHDWLQSFADGLYALADKHHIALVGGDTTQGPLSITIQVMGSVKQSYLSRSGALPGEQIFVSGSLGSAAACVQLRRNKKHTATALNQALDWPQPRNVLGIKLLDYASSCIDISDGLSADLGHILKASGVAAEVQIEQIPIAAELAETMPRALALPLALSGGDDYQLCFTVAEQQLQNFLVSDDPELKACTAIGQIVAGQGLKLLDINGETKELALAGYQHFGTV